VKIVHATPVLSTRRNAASARRSGWPTRANWPYTTAEHDATAAILTRRATVAFLAPQSPLALVTLIALGATFADFAISSIYAVAAILTRWTFDAFADWPPDTSQPAWANNAFTWRADNAFTGRSLDTSRPSRADNAFTGRATFAGKTNWANNGLARWPTVSRLSVLSRQTLNSLPGHTLRALNAPTWRAFRPRRTLNRKAIFAIGAVLAILAWPPTQSPKAGTYRLVARIEHRRAALPPNMEAQAVDINKVRADLDAWQPQ
jgi:hypothetical protein